jgi:hypothetical protein
MEENSRRRSAVLSLLGNAAVTAGGRSVLLDSVAQEHKGKVCLVLYIITVLYIFAVIISFTAYRQAFYTIKPSACNLVRDENSTSMGLLGDLTLSIYGACLSQQMPNARKSLDVNGTESDQYYVYHQCLSFDSPSSFGEWKLIDRENAARGVPTQLMTDTRAWNSASANILTASLFLLFGLFSWMLAMGRCLRMKFLSVPIGWSTFCIVFSFLSWLGALGSMKGTDQLKTKAWSTYVFDGCSVAVVKSMGVSLGSLTTVISFSLLAFKMSLMYMLRRYNLFAQRLRNYDPYNPYDDNPMLRQQPGEAVLSPIAPYGNSGFAVVHVRPVAVGGDYGHAPQQQMVYVVPMNPTIPVVASTPSSDYELGLYSTRPGSYNYPGTATAPSRPLYAHTTAVAVPSNYVGELGTVAAARRIGNASNTTATGTNATNTTITTDSRDGNSNSNNSCVSVPTATATPADEFMLEGAIVGTDFYYHPSMFDAPAAVHVEAQTVPAPPIAQAMQPTASAMTYGEEPAAALPLPASALTQDGSAIRGEPRDDAVHGSSSGTTETRTTPNVTSSPHDPSNVSGGREYHL